MRSLHFNARTVAAHLFVAAAMVLLNFSLPQREPLAFALLHAAIVIGFEPFTVCGAYVVASVTALSFEATLSAAVQAALYLVLAVIYRKKCRRMGYERLAYALVAQLPFIFLFPHAGYDVFPFAPVYQKLLIAALVILLTVLFEGAMEAVCLRLFRTRLGAGELAELATLWLFAGMGMLSSVGEPCFYLVSLGALLFFVVLAKSAAAVPFAVAISLPLTLYTHAADPIALFTVCACAALLVCPYGKAASALSLVAVFLGAMFFEGLYVRTPLEIALTVLACLLPALLAVCIPERLLRRAEKTLLFYRERALPRIAVNRSRRAVGEQLYEVSSLFRDIGQAFEAQNAPDHTASQIRGKLQMMLCNSCPNRGMCAKNRLFDSFDKLIAVGKAKGKVNLIDLPLELSQNCSNSAGLLFALNKLLAEYARMDMQLEAARAGRNLLAEQARGISEVLRELALEQSEEYVFSDEERRLASALAKEGLLAAEIFLYGEGAAFTASITLPHTASGKDVCRAASEALGRNLALSEKLPLGADRACFILRARPVYDASFGVASRVKEGETAGGDTHSILKIDERRFLVALSDGMGSGEEARAVSDRTLTLIESFYKAKMPSATVLSTVNSLIAFSSEETFACLDLAAVDLDTGIADVVKIGSPIGFVLSGETLQVLEGDSLPIGALEAVHPACLRVEMQEGDFLIFMSDGITTAFGSSSELCSYLSRLHPLNPQSLAEEILDNALGRYRGRAEDDMTVVTVKLTKSA